MSLETINFDHLKLRSGQKILDLGCGEGRHAITAYLLEDVTSVGIDLSLKDLTTTRERFSQFEESENSSKSLFISVAEGQALPFTDNTFDKVICSEVLEHIENYQAVIDEILRVIKPGGLFAVSVPRFGPEWVCWKLSKGYHEVKGGHIRIFKAKELKDQIEASGFVHFKRHWAHALHVPYWWLKCLFWKSAEKEESDEAWIVKTYHKLLVWDLMKRPWLTLTLEKLLNPIMGKSVVMYFVKALI